MALTPCRNPRLRLYLLSLTLVAAVAALVACGRTEASSTATPSEPTATAAAVGSGQSTPTATVPAGSSSPTAVASPPTGTPSQTATATPVPVVEFQEMPVPPERDLYELGRRLRLRQAEDVPMFAEPAPAPLEVGDEVEWTVNRDSGNVSVDARVMAVSDNAYWLFDTDFLPAQSQVNAAVAEFESNVWPRVTEVFGMPWTPGVDGDPRIVVFHSRLRTGVGGYFSSADEYPRVISPISNERETIYMSSNIVPGSTGYNSILGHELQHAIHWAYDKSEESWVNEGLSEYASVVAGYQPGSINSFVRNPGVSLIEWATEISGAAANYGASALFMEYLAHHYGGSDLVSDLVQDSSDGVESIDNVLSAAGHSAGLEDVFADWVIANYLDEESGPYSYPGRSMPDLSDASIGLSNTISASVRPFGADYWLVANALGDVTLSFEAETTASIFGAEPYSGDTCWWTNAGDSINSRLVRDVDLRSVGRATLRFWAWYEIEEDWDYAYVTVSTDGGVTWQTVQSNRSTSSDPNGNSYGHGITGHSDGWVQVEADLSEFTGLEVQLAIEYITDDAIHERGGCFDDFSIPELGWFDDTSDDGAWVSDGFARANHLQPQEWLVQVIRQRVGQPAEVAMVPVDGEGTGSVTLTDVGQTETVVVVVSAVQRGVTGRAEYSFRLERD